MTVLLRRFAADGRADPSMVDARGATAWTELDERVNQWVHALRRRGLRPGDRFAIVAGNRRETFEAVLAGLHCELVVVPVNTNLTAPEIGYVLRDSGSAAVLVDPDRAGTVAEALAGATEKPGAAGKPDATAEPDAAGTHDVTVRLVTGDQPLAGFEPVEPALASAPATEPADQVCGTLMLYTSGTTGAPKGVRNGLFRAGAPFARVEKMLDYAGRVIGVPGPEGRLLLVGPWYHSAQLFFALMSLLRGAGLVIHDRFDPAATIAAIDAARISHCHLVPTQFVRMLRLDEPTRDRFHGTSLRRVWHGGGPCTVDTKRRMLDWWGPVLVEYYAATEGGIATLIDAEQWQRRPGSVGRAVPPTEVLIVDAGGVPVPAGQVGRVFLRRQGGQSFTYHNAPAQTREAHLGDGLFTYGELGYLDEDGYLFLTGRAKDMVVSGGVNVYPAEVEAALLAHPAVLDAAVIGVPDDEFGERVVAVVQLVPGTDPDRAVSTLDGHCRTRLAGFKVPRDYHFDGALPRDPAGKLKKAQVLEAYQRASAPARAAC